jgi:hypothetical protein
LLFLIRTLLNNQGRDNSDVQHLLAIGSHFESPHLAPIKIKPRRIEDGQKGAVFVIHESGMALPVILLPAVREPGLSMDLKRCMLDMFESDNPDIVFEMHFSDPFFIPAQETCSHGWSGLRSTMNDDFMIGQNLAVVEGFLSVSEQDERARVRGSAHLRSSG